LEPESNHARASAEVKDGGPGGKPLTSIESKTSPLVGKSYLLMKVSLARTSGMRILVTEAAGDTDELS